MEDQWKNIGLPSLSEAESLVIKIFREKTTAERLAIAFEANRFAREKRLREAFSRSIPPGLRSECRPK